MGGVVKLTSCFSALGIGFEKDTGDLLIVMDSTVAEADGAALLIRAEVKLGGLIFVSDLPLAFAPDVVVSLLF